LPVRVSVVIANHGHERWIRDAIVSVAHQDYPDKRVVVVDDGSPDNSVSVIANWLKNTRPGGRDGVEWLDGTVPGTDCPCRLIACTPARGPAAARNLGVSTVLDESDALMFLDADDQYLPGKIAKSVEAFSRDPVNVGGVYSDYDTLDPATGRVIRNFKASYGRNLLHAECVVNMASLVGKEAWVETGGFDPALRVKEDYDLWLRMSRRKVIVHIPESLVLLRVGGHSSTATVPHEVHVACMNRVAEKVREGAR
jgi:glycosyltransferase involved in cell wall biosynthesis